MRNIDAITLLDELRSVGVEFVSLNEGIDANTPAGKLSRRGTETAVRSVG
jgi:DNA invertase Pin-like site-specific DNA recombinase